MDCDWCLHRRWYFVAGINVRREFEQTARLSTVANSCVFVFARAIQDWMDLYVEEIPDEFVILT